MVHPPVDTPNPFQVLISVVRSLRQTKPPNPSGDRQFDHEAFGPVLTALASAGLPGVAAREAELGSYLESLANAEPDTLTRDEALAFWINLYNAGAISLAIDVFHDGQSSVLRIPGGFSRPLVEVEEETLSLDAIEHAKIRRFGDPRIHGALVCGSLSCPTLSAQPYDGMDLDSQLDDQMKSFLSAGGAVAAEDGFIELSRVFKWFGSDFVRPHRMPTFVPASRKSTLGALQPWISSELDGRQQMRYQTYDWGLACAVR